MSSGNPFRASQAFAQPAPGPHASFVNMTADVRVSEARWGDSDHGIIASALLRLLLLALKE